MKWTKEEQVINEFKRGNISQIDVRKKLCISSNHMNSIMHRIDLSGDLPELDKYRIHGQHKKYKGTKKKIIESREKYMELNGYYPTATWIARDVGISSERVRQLMQNTLYSKRGAVRINSASISIEFSDMLKKISIENNVNFSEALKIFSFKFMRGDFN